MSTKYNGKVCLHYHTQGYTVLFLSRPKSFSHNKMWESIRGRWNTIDLFYNIVKIKFPFYVLHVISYITKQDRQYR